MKIGITGNQGFIGKHIFNDLENKKNVELFGFDLPKDDLLNPLSLEKFVKNKDIIIHTATVNRGDDADIIRSGVIGTHNLITAVKKSKRKIKIIFLSSIQAENNSTFGISKRFAETLLQDFSKKEKNPVTIFRVINVFGEGGKPYYNSVVATFCYQIKHNKPITISNDKRKINFIYIKDLTKIITEEVFTKRKEPFFFKKTNTRNSVTIKELAKIIKSFKDKKEVKSKFHKDLYKTFLSY